MSRIDRNSLQLRAQEIINGSADGMTVQQALKRALLERYANDPDGLAEACAMLAAGTMSGLRRRTYELPDSQGSLFEPPAIIGIRTEDGDLLVPRQHASLGQVKQWQREGQQHHATQLLRFKRAGADLEPLKDEEENVPWWSARAMLVQVENGSDDAADQ